MAVPTAPTLTDLANESLAKAGITPAQANYPYVFARATSRWIEEIKNDIWQAVGASYNRRLKSLQSTAIQIGVVGKSQYSMPSDFEDVLDVCVLGSTRITRSSTLAASSSGGSSVIGLDADTIAAIGVGDVAIVRLDSGADQSVLITSVGSSTIGFSPVLSGAATIGNVITFQYAITAQGSASLTLSAGEAATEDFMIGKSLLLITGNGAGQLAQVIAYNAVSRVATLNAALAIAPAAGDIYIVADKPVQISEFSEVELDFATIQASIGMPRQFTDYQGVLTFDRPFDQQYGIRVRYFANIHKLDSSGTVMLAIYQNWQEVLAQGFYVKALQGMAAKEYTTEFQVYKTMLQDLIARENPWVDGTDQISVDPWLTPFRGLAASSLSIGRY